LLPKHALKGKSFSPIYSIRLKLIDIQHLPKRKRKIIQLKKIKTFWIAKFDCKIRIANVSEIVEIVLVFFSFLHFFSESRGFKEVLKMAKKSF